MRALLPPLSATSTLAHGQQKEKVMIPSWGDVIWQHKGERVGQLDTPEKVREAVGIWKSRRVTKVLFRVDVYSYREIVGGGTR